MSELRQPLLGDKNVPRGSKAGGTATFDLAGLTCAACVQTINNALARPSPTWRNLRVGLFPSAFLKVELNSENDLDGVKADIVETVENVGFECSFRRFDQAGTGDRAKKRVIVFSNMGVSSLDVKTDGLSVISSVAIPEEDSHRFELEYDAEYFRGVRDVIEWIESKYVEVKRVQVSDSASELKSDMEKRQQREFRYWRNHMLFSMFFAIPALVIAMGPGMTGMMDDDNMSGHDDMHTRNGFHRVIPSLNLSVIELVMFLLTTPVMFVSGYPFHREAISSVVNFRRKTLGMSLLVSLGATSAYSFSVGVLLRNAELRSKHKPPMNVHDNFETCALLIAFVTLGKFLETYAKSKTNQALTSLAELRSSSSAVLVETDPKGAVSEREIAWYLIQTGDILRCALGSRIPADGVVLEGRGLIDQAALTGESMPVEKSEGDHLMGGSILIGGGGLTMRVTDAGEDTALSKIIQLVENAQTDKAPIERLSDEISKRFVPLIVGISLLTFIVWTCIIKFDVTSNEEEGVPDAVLPFIFALSVLVVACPCALGLATPTAVMVGSGVGASLGVLIKSGSALEALANVNCFVFDKTGTLTKGQLDVEEILPLGDDLDLNNYLALAAVAERNSDHPIAKAINRRALSDPSVGPLTLHWTAEKLEEFGGKGIKCFVANHRVLVGNISIFDSVPQGIRETVAGLEKKGCTGVVVEVDGKFRLAIGLRDESKDDASAAVGALQAMGSDVYMITGDNFLTAHVIASEVGIKPENVLANVLPSDKASAVRALQKVGGGRRVAMVGDGINDAPALVAADVGIAIGAGTQIAIEAADMVLMNSRLLDVVTAFDLSRAVLRRIKMNYIWALVYNLVGVVFACGFFYPWSHKVLPPWVAAGAMAFSSVSVVTSSLLLRGYKRPRIEVEFGKRRGGPHELVRVDSVWMRTSEGITLRHEIDAGCAMLEGHACSCDASKCTCKLCEIHAPSRNLEDTTKETKQRGDVETLV